MKLTLTLLVLGVSGLFASEINSQTVRVNLKMKNVKTRTILNEIERQTDYLFLFSPGDVDVDRMASVEAKNQTVAQVLSSLFKKTDVSYALEGTSIFLIRGNKEVNSTEQDKKTTITGTVRDKAGEPIIGANILEIGAVNGTITDLDGKFSVSVSEGAVLQISYIGYLTKEVTVGTQRVLDITLSDDFQTLDEVVVVGYGTMKKSDVTGSISVTAGSDILKGQTFNALEGLRGKAAGVTILSNSGQPGGAQRVLIRGMSTINTNSDPLYIVDGVAMESMQYLNPNDIERIEVLKDASSAAIYGARGANGVIMVTTKRGLKDEGVSVSYTGSVSLSTMARYMDLMNASEWQQAFIQGVKNYNKWYAEPGQERSENLADHFKDARLFNADGTAKYDTDWQKEATRDAISHSHQISIQQGGKKSSIGAFLNYTDQQGLMLNTYMKRLNAKLTYDAKPTDYLSTAVNLLVNHTWANETEESGGAQYPRRTMIEFVPWLPQKLDGQWTNHYIPTDDVNLEGMANPVHVLKSQERVRYRTQIFGNAAFTFHLAPGLDLKTQFGLDVNLNQNRYYTPNDLIDLSYPEGQVDYTDLRYHYWQEETYLTYTNAFDKHRINAMGGISWQERVYRKHTSSRKGYVDNYSGSDNIGAGTIPRDPTSEYERWGMNSYFVRGAYTYDDKYSATVTARVDGSSKFGKSNKYAFFPSAGFAWNMSNEEFMSDVSFIDMLKLHTSYGITGNSEIPVYRSLSTISSGSVLINGSLVPSSYIERLPNKDLKWETTAMWDIGFNLNMFGNRLNFDVSYYHKTTRDLLLERPLPHTTGFDNVWYNIGKVRNQGIDFMINTVNVDTRDFRWTSTLNFNYNKNEILKLGENNEDIITGPDSKVLLRVGESLATFRGYKRNGVWTEQERDEALAAGQNVGQSKHSDSQEIVGNGLPKFTGSFINNFSYKNLDLLIDIQFVAGVDAYQSYLHSAEDRFGGANGLKTILYDGYDGTNPNTQIQAVRNFRIWDHGMLSQQDSHYVADGSYIRGNLIQLGYTFSKKMTQKMRINDLRLSLSVNNAFLICSDDFKGYDPEGSSYTGDSYDKWGQNIYFFQYPKARTYTLGVNVTF